MSPRPLNALLISDGKPGHYHQAEGVIAALARLRPVNTTRIDAWRRLLIPTRTLLQLVNWGTDPVQVLRFGYGIRASELASADIVVSAGGETLAANAAAAKVLGAANIFCGRLRRLAPQHVRLVLVTLDSLALGPNYLVCLPPSPMDVAGALSAERGERRFGRDAAPARVGVLIGGDSGAYRYRDRDWLALTRFLRQAHSGHGVRFLATTSRRSGSGIADALAAMAAEPDSPLETFIDFRTAGPGTLQRILAAVDAVVCTDDSTTMIAETVGACVPLVALTPQSSRLEPREAEFRRHLADNGWYRQLPLAALTAESFLAALEEIGPRTTSAREELAAAIAGRLPEVLTAEEHDRATPDGG